MKHNHHEWERDTNDKIFNQLTNIYTCIRGYMYKIVSIYTYVYIYMLYKHMHI